MSLRIPRPKTLNGAAQRAALLSFFLMVLGRSLCAQPFTYTNYEFSTLAGSAGVVGSADGAGTAAQFFYPWGIALDERGDVYVADWYNHTIRKITAAGVVTTLAGMAGVPGSADGSGSAARFNYPAGVAVDKDGNVYVADSFNATIRKITAGGVVTTLAGTAGVLGGADGTGPAAQFFSPAGVAVDSAGNVYVADEADCTIRKITPGGVVTTLAGTAGRYGSTDGTGATARFNHPVAVAADSIGNLYVVDTNTPVLATFRADYGGTIRKVTPGGVVTTLAGTAGVIGSADGTGPAAQFDYPGGLAVDIGGNVYVADAGNNTIRKITAGGVVTTLAGSPGVKGTADGIGSAAQFSGPSGVAVDYDGNVQVADTFNETIRIGHPFINKPSGLPTFVIRHAAVGGNALWGIAAGPPGLVAVGAGGTILSSTDGSSWTRRASGTTNWLTAVTFGGGQYVAVGDSGCVLLSTDAATWSPVAQAVTTERLNGVVYAIGRYVAVGEAGSIITSADGRNWSACNSGVTGWLRGLAYTGEVDEGTYSTSMGPTPATITARFVAAGQGGAVVTSTYGKTWVGFGYLGEETASEDVEAVASDKSSHFVALGAGGALFTNDLVGGGTLDFTYEDLDVYGPPPAPSLHYRGLVQGSSGLVLTGEDGTVLTAPGISGPWSNASTGTSANLVAGVAIGDSVFIVGEDETILQLSPPTDSRLINLSCRAQVGTGANVLIAGFVVGGAGNSGSDQGLLIRGSGPALVPFGVSGTLPDPELQLFSTASASSLVATNTGWNGNGAASGVAAVVGAFPWSNPSSHDAALVYALAPGPYTANVSGKSGDTGVALAELYDATPSGSYTATSPRLVNLSARSQAGSGSGSLIAGFVIGGSTPKTVLIRASGPALVPLGVSGTLPDPELQVYSTASGSTLLASNAGWGGDVQIATAAAWVGAFPWANSATPDSALLLTLAPGPYTANVTGASGDTGIALVEVYEVQ